MSIELFNSYIDGVTSGEIVTGKYVRLCVERHVKDIARQGTEDFPYTFNEAVASQAVEAFPVLFRHTVGSYAGNPFVLSPWQAFVVGSLWGWKDSRNLRRFNRAYVTLSRKQGKSTLAAGIAILMAAFDNEPQAQCYIGASKIDQAKIIFEECKRMIGSNPDLAKQFDRRSLQINHDASNSFIRPLGSDRAFDGLNPSLVLFDELHVWRNQHRGFYDTLTTGSAARSQPLRFTITTAGSTSSEIWIEEQTLAEKLMEGTYEEERYFAFLAQLDKDDNVFDEANWPKSMPNLGVSVSPDYIREAAAEAKTSKVGENRFRRYFANIQVSPLEQAIEIDKWNACESDLSNWKSADTICAGIDIGGRNDMASVSFVARFHDGKDDDGTTLYRYEVKTINYMDSDTRRDLNEMPWAQFIADGSIKVVEYIHKSIYDDVTRFMLSHGHKQIAFDPWNSQQLAEELDRDGFQSIQVQQNRFKMNEPVMLLLDLVDKKKIAFQSDKVLTWCASNLVLNFDSAGRCLPDKAESNGKIDAIVATIMALKLASLAPERPRGNFFIT